MLIIQLDKTDADILYNNDYFKMIDAKDGVIYDDRLIIKAFTDYSQTLYTDSPLIPYKKFNDYMKEVSKDYLFYDLIHYKFIKEIPLK